ncbi:hypothetical protein BJX70DRAFT_371978 [Aspergillus crustosus]
MFPGDPVSSSFDYTSLTSTAFPTSHSTTAETIDWTALGCLPGSSAAEQELGLVAHPANSLESQSQVSFPSVGSPDTPFDHINSNTNHSHHPTPLITTNSPPTSTAKPTTRPLMPSVSATTTFPTPSRSTSPKDAPSRVSKRELNTMAARRYRQRRLDRVSQLEEELEAVKRERDELRMRVSKLEGETDALRGMLKEK